MRFAKNAFILALVAGSFGIGHLMRGRTDHVRPEVTASTPVTAAPAEVEPPTIDPSLILPPPSAQGMTMDMPIDDIRKHFREKARIGPPPRELIPFEPPLLIPVVSNDEPRSLPPPVIRLPAPPEEPQPPATVKRVLHRQLAMWMYVNERDLRLNFDVTKRGSSGIKAVELWARRNSESDYECIDRMIGDKPPFATRLGSEGNYELRLVFVSGSGNRSSVLQRDDLGDIFVCLDTTPPQVELLPPSAIDAATVNLRWKATDANLDEQPIRLAYSVDGETWQPIAEENDWLPNSGEYAWKLPAGLPHEVDIRIQARDKAGNIGEARSPSKFSVDLVVPEGRISGVVERGPEAREAAAVEPRSHVLAEFTPPYARRNSAASSTGSDEQTPLQNGEPEMLPPPREYEPTMDVPNIPDESEVGKYRTVLRDSDWELRYIGPWEKVNQCMFDWLRTENAKPVSSETHRPPPTVFAPFPPAIGRLELTKNFGLRWATPPYPSTGGGWWEQDFELTELVVPQPSNPIPSLSNRHASFLEALGPPRPWLEMPGILGSLPSGHYLDPLPDWFPKEPDFPLPRELAYQEESAGVLKQIPELLPQPCEYVPSVEMLKIPDEAELDKYRRAFGDSRSDIRYIGPWEAEGRSMIDWLRAGMATPLLELLPMPSERRSHVSAAELDAFFQCWIQASALQHCHGKGGSFSEQIQDCFLKDFARLPVKHECFLLALKRYYKEPYRIWYEAEEISNPWLEQFPALPSDFNVPTWHHDDFWISRRHASYLSQLDAKRIYTPPSPYLREPRPLKFMPLPSYRIEVLERSIREIHLLLRAVTDNRPNPELLPIPRLLMSARDIQPEWPSIQVWPPIVTNEYELQTEKRTQPAAPPLTSVAPLPEIDFCSLMHQLRTTPVVTATQKPLVVRDSKKFNRPYSLGQFARLPAAALRFELMQVEGFRSQIEDDQPTDYDPFAVLLKSGRPTGSFMGFGGVTRHTPEVYDDWDKTHAAEPPLELADLIIHAPLKHGPYLSPRHDSFLEALGPARTWTDLRFGGPVGIEFNY